MHELSIASAVLRCAERHALGRPVVTVRVRVGALRQVVPASLAFHWENVARRTVCEHAALELERVPARARCPRCGRDWQLSEPVLRCPACAAPATVIAGDELEVDSIEVEEVDARCTA
jgi:hydrogenase nickel incorporation protein HypA/HybF